MFGSILSAGIRLATLPLDIADAGMDVLAGGDGNKRSRSMGDSPLTMLTDIRDAATKACEDLDK